MHGRAESLLSTRLGSTVLLTDSDGNIVWQNDFTPFGEETGESGFQERNGFYTGKKLDEDTGLFYFNARWYDASLGKFITEDPIKDGVNWMVYCANNPMTMIDPTGLRTKTVSYDDQNNQSTDHSKDDGYDDPDNGNNQELTPDELMQEELLNPNYEVKIVEYNYFLDIERWEENNRANSFAAGALPIIGEIKDVLDILAGEDIFTGEELSDHEIGLTAVAAFAPLISGRNIIDAVDGIKDGIRSLDGVIADLPRNANRLKEAYRAVQAGSELSPILKKALRSQGRRILRANGQSVLGKQVHHIIPLEWANKMGKNFNPNSLGNLVPLSRKTHTNVTNSWADFKRNIPNPSTNQIEAFAATTYSKWE